MGFVDYTNQHWTNDNAALMALYYLGVSSKLMPEFEKVPNSKKILSNTLSLIPTFSPNDPKFNLKSKEHSVDGD